nr:unnamed protein product [Haemonchus contortus]
MVPDLQRGLASAVLAVLQEVGLHKVLIVFSEEFKLAADFLTVKLGQNAKTLYFSYEADLFWPHDVEGLIR